MPSIAEREIGSVFEIQCNCIPLCTVGHEQFTEKRVLFRRPIATAEGWIEIILIALAALAYISVWHMCRDLFPIVGSEVGNEVRQHCVFIGSEFVLAGPSISHRDS
jgi:hypothetical protein